MTILSAQVNLLSTGESALPQLCQTPPTLNSAHLKELRRIWAYGRQVRLSKLSPVHLDLFALGLLAQTQSTNEVLLYVTPQGVASISDARQSLIASQARHNTLGARLCAHLRAKNLLTWENIELLNPRRDSEEVSWTAVRPDVYACTPTNLSKNAAPAIFEIKISRSDFHSDLRHSVKGAAYRELACAFYYCCPHGLIEKEELPPGAGLIVETDSGAFEVLQRPKRTKNFVPHPDTLMSLLYKTALAQR